MVELILEKLAIESMMLICILVVAFQVIKIWMTR
jgi:hypothetical protein